MYDINVSDFVDIKENKSGIPVENFIHICKRTNNAKREYLFVNRDQGKHFPQSPFHISLLYKVFYNEIKKSLYRNERIIVIGFAETATALAESVAYEMHKDTKITSSLVYYLQTTRENYKAPKLFDFNEEHSHAVNQSLYCCDSLPEFDRILFIEDEITTGNTILNFISEFKKINPNCKYSVASVLNWQNEYNRQKFKNAGIERIYLVCGDLREDVPFLIDYNFSTCEDYYNIDVAVDFLGVRVNNNGIKNPRLGVTPDYFDDVDRLLEILKKSDIDSFLNPDDKVMVIGTEECMFIPLKFARYIESYYELETSFRATTRSPISVSSEKGYILNNSIMVHSAYDDDRVTYLYNMYGDYNKILVITDAHMRNKFPVSLVEFANRNNKEIFFVEINDC